MRQKSLTIVFLIVIIINGLVSAVTMHFGTAQSRIQRRIISTSALSPSIYGPNGSNTGQSISFEADLYVSASAGPNGYISPSGNVTVNFGGSQSFNITGRIGFHIADVVADDVSQGPISSYTFSNVTVTHTIFVTFAINTYTITVTQVAGGQIVPDTTVVNYGDTQRFTITPATGYHIFGVLVDSALTDALGEYTFTNIVENHSISAIFVFNPVTIIASPSAGGSISPNGATYLVYGGNQDYSIIPNTGYHVTDVFVDDVSVGAVTSYKFINVVDRHTISAIFAINTFNIFAYAGNGGSINPSGSVGVNYGDNQDFNITANAGYYISDVSVNGSSIGAISHFTFNNVQFSYNISATFAQISTPTPTTNPKQIATNSPNSTSETTSPTVQPSNKTPSPSPRIPEFPFFAILTVFAITIALASILTVPMPKKPCLMV